MKILLVFNAHQNGGDYLIRERVSNAIKKFYISANISKVNENESQLSIDFVNSHDLVVTGGGGAQLCEEYIKKTFLYKNIDEIEIPVHYMGTGLYGEVGTDSFLYSYKYDEETKSFFKKIGLGGGQIGARDQGVYAVLKNNNIKDVTLSGCPAWYDTENLPENIKFERPKGKLIAISNPGKTKFAIDQGEKLRQVKSLVAYLEGRYPDAKFLMTFNDGYDTKYSAKFNYQLRDYAENKSIECLDLSASEERFTLLDQVDLHVGYRVHTHIYLLSKGIVSFLIEEDLRGYGMNTTLGLSRITSHDEVLTRAGSDFVANEHLINSLNIALEMNHEEDYLRFDLAASVIKNYYETGMKSWLKFLGTYQKP